MSKTTTTNLTHNSHIELHFWLKAAYKRRKRTSNINADGHTRTTRIVWTSFTLHLRHTRSIAGLHTWNRAVLYIHIPKHTYSHTCGLATRSNNAALVFGGRRVAHSHSLGWLRKTTTNWLGSVQECVEAPGVSPLLYVVEICAWK